MVRKGCQISIVTEDVETPGIDSETQTQVLLKNRKCSQLWIISPAITQTCKFLFFIFEVIAYLEVDLFVCRTVCCYYSPKFEKLIDQTWSIIEIFISFWISGSPIEITGTEFTQYRNCQYPIIGQYERIFELYLTGEHVHRS